MQSQTMIHPLQTVVAAACDLPTDIARLVLANADERPRISRLGADPDAGLDASRPQATRP